jgi:ATP-binding cassette subfamily F protein 3
LSEHTATINNLTTADDDDNNQQKKLSNKERKQLEAKQRQKTAPLRKKIKQLESNMETLSKKLLEIEQQLSDSDIYAENNKQKLQQLLLEKAELDRQHEADELNWLENSEKLESLISNTF